MHYINSLFTMIVPFIVILCIMVVIHEFGHFIVAKLLGIGAEVFSVGFGPRLFGFKLGETDFRLSAVPLGGYVRFKGENLEMLQGKSEADADEFLSQPGWKRLLVALAGPVFNIVTAILIPAAAILIGFEDDIINSQQVVIADVRADTPAAAAGLQKGDRIIGLNGKKNPTWQDLQDEVMVRIDEPVPVIVERNGQQLQINLTPRVEMIKNDKIGRLDLEPPTEYLNVGAVSADSPAAAAGVKAGDKIRAINGVAVYASSQLPRAAQAGTEMALTLERNGQTVEVKATPVKKDDGVYRLGLSYQRPFVPVQVKTSSLATALQFGWDFNMRILRMTGVVFKQMFNGRRSPRDVLGGPIKIAQETAQTYEQAGWGGTIRLMGLLSLNLGLFNLFPIPVLDGGMILMIIIEGLLGLVGMTVTMGMREKFQQVGFVIVLLLMGFVIVNDSASLIFGR